MTFAWILLTAAGLSANAQAKDAPPSGGLGHEVKCYRAIQAHSYEKDMDLAEIAGATAIVVPNSQATVGHPEFYIYTEHTAYKYSLPPRDGDHLGQDYDLRLKIPERNHFLFTYNYEVKRPLHPSYQAGFIPVIDKEYQDTKGTDLLNDEVRKEIWRDLGERIRTIVHHLMQSKGTIGEYRRALKACEKVEGAAVKEAIAAATAGLNQAEAEAKGPASPDTAADAVDSKSGGSAAGAPVPPKKK